VKKRVGKTDLFVGKMSFINLKAGLGFDQTNVRFPGIQFTKQFIEFVLLETNQFFVSISNVILTRQTCGHRSSKVAGSKRRALVFYFSGARRKPQARATRIQSDSIRTVP